MASFPSITDAILGACNMGDISKMLPLKNKNLNIKSTILLKDYYEDKSKNFSINNLILIYYKRN